MKQLIVMALLGLIAVSAEAKKNCTDEPKEKWLKEDEFKAKVEGLGYKIKKFKQPGSCYEIYGVNKDGKKVEVYFNPVDATIVKEEID